MELISINFSLSRKIFKSFQKRIQILKHESRNYKSP